MKALLPILVLLGVLWCWPSQAAAFDQHSRYLEAAEPLDQHVHRQRQQWSTPRAIDDNQFLALSSVLRRLQSRRQQQQHLQLAVNRLADSNTQALVQQSDSGKTETAHTATAPTNSTQTEDQSEPLEDKGAANATQTDSKHADAAPEANNNEDAASANATQAHEAQNNATKHHDEPKKDSSDGEQKKKEKVEESVDDEESEDESAKQQEAENLKQLEFENKELEAQLKTITELVLKEVNKKREKHNLKDIKYCKDCALAASEHASGMQTATDCDPVAFRNKETGKVGNSNHKYAPLYTYSFSVQDAEGAVSSWSGTDEGDAELLGKCVKEAGCAYAQCHNASSDSGDTVPIVMSWVCFFHPNVLLFGKNAPCDSMG